MCKKVNGNKKNVTKRRIALISITALFMSLFTGCSTVKEEEKKEITISVAASLSEPINKIKGIYEENNNVKINVNTGGSGTLKKQISQGADVDIFFSASEKYIDQLKEEGLLKEEDTYPLLFNALVVVKNNLYNKDITSIDELKGLDMKLALGETNTVPAGEYAKEALENAGVWNEVEDKVVYGKDVKVVKTYIENGDVDLGIIYKSDSIDLKNSTALLEIPSNLHKKIIYSIGVISKGKNYEESKNFVDFIKSDEGLNIFKDYGFSIN
ncbi:molybdate ABC transporter substrate-binding protein [Clostridium sp.]|uniref:molybdate ABC transporter substrate-binding protein n=1 Tax=Clostridium sp. TaxID=1506 RepID=UPI003F33E6CA